MPTTSAYAETPSVCDPLDQLQALFSGASPWACPNGNKSETGYRREVDLELDQHQMRLQRMRRGVKAAAIQIQNQCEHSGRRYYAAMITLTYADQFQWGSRDIAGFLANIRKWAYVRGVSVPYLWVLELTKRGRPHYHVMVWLPVGYMLPKPDRRGWWKWGSSRIERARSAVGYLIKYASKGVSQGDLPKGARISGVGGLDRFRRMKLAWHRLPEYVREVMGTHDRPVRALGGGFMSQDSGKVVRSPWRCLGVYWGRVFLRKTEDEPVFVAQSG